MRRKKKRIPTGKVSKLKKLIKERKFLERQKMLDRFSIQDSLKVEKVEPEPQKEAVQLREPFKETNEMSSSLLGYTQMDILLMEVDGLLTKEELAWIRKRPGRLDRRQYIPSENGWMH